MVFLQLPLGKKHSFKSHDRNVGTVTVFHLAFPSTDVVHCNVEMSWLLEA